MKWAFIFVFLIEIEFRESAVYLVQIEIARRKIC